ncbi:retrovirus-related pol polyprotein from transposon TNT 1-94 [Tanacetum coccineum]|uniref:Retrovirus-related pol polyprotein from transposon TNT 1-94 n=1 Tax=Tanacetum coccineum TaxID=301880 RepID=A0ABQ5I5W5_9ASTR
MVIYNALPRKEYERIFMCNKVKEIWKTLLITYQDSDFAGFKTIITSLKALDEGYSSKNYVRKFLRDIHPKWRAKIMAIEELKYLTSLSLEELIENLKAHEMIIKKDYKIFKAKVERKYLALKVKKESSDEECLISRSEDEEYAMAVRDFKKFFKRRGRCGDPNHLIGECLKPPRDKNQKAFVRGSWSNSGEEDDEKAKDKICLIAHASSEHQQVVTKKTELEKSQKETSSGGDPLIADGGPLKVQMAPKVNQGLPVCSSENGKYVSFQKSILCPRLKHIIVNDVKILVASDDEICLGMDLEPDEWIKDSGCSKYMTCNRKLFSTYKAYNGGQICDNKYKVLFSKHDSEITKDGKVPGRGIRKSDVYLELLHMDLFSPSAIRSYGGNLYTLVIVDDCSREFDNEVQFREFCNANGITHNFSALRTPQSNSMVEWKNRTIQEMSRTMLNEQSLPQKFWCNVVDTLPTPYELLRGRKLTLDYFKVFGSKCFILKTKDYLTKFDPKSYEDVFLARLESIGILLAYACALDFKLFQMDVKSAFLNSFINEEVYVAQPSGFIDFEKPNHVYKLKKALYGLRLKAFLIKHEYNMGMIETTKGWPSGKRGCDYHSKMCEVSSSIPARCKQP